jgi:hypothetical protein
MSDENKRRTQHMVPQGDSVIEHGKGPTSYVRPPKPPMPIKDGGAGISKKKS